MKIWKNKLLLFLLAFLVIFTACNNQQTESNQKIESNQNIQSNEKADNKAQTESKIKAEEKSEKQDKPTIKEDKDSIYINLVQVQKDESYYSLEEVASYLMTEGKLPKNFLTKKEAIKMGWVAKEGNLWEVTDKKAIGGDYFGNREGILPEKKGRKYFEADIDYHGGRRNAKRLIYTNDKKMYYTKDHYKTFKEVKIK